MKIKQILSSAILALFFFAAVISTAAILPKAQAATISITTMALPAATINQAYSAAIQFNSLGAVPITAIFLGLPAGITYPNTSIYTNNAFGTGSVSLSGVPSVSGTFNVTLTLADNGTNSATQAYTLVVNAAAGMPVTAPGYIVSPAPVTIPAPAPVVVPAPGPITPAIPQPAPNFANPLLSQPAQQQAAPTAVATPSQPLPNS